MQKFNQIGVFVVFVSSCSCSCLFRWKIPKTYCSSSYTGSICVCKIGKILCVRNSKIHTVCKTFFFQKINKFICFTCARNIIVSRNSESFVCARKLRTKWRQSVYSAFYRMSQVRFCFFHSPSSPYQTRTLFCTPIRVGFHAKIQGSVFSSRFCTVRVIFILFIDRVI